MNKLFKQVLKTALKLQIKIQKLFQKDYLKILKKLNCQTISLSYFIKKKGISKIDLLKIDAEKSEIDILKGINKKDWKKIKNIIIESHTQDNSNYILSL